MSQYFELSFKEVQQNFLKCVQFITRKKVMDLSTTDYWINEAKQSEINQEILDNLDEILFLKGYRNPVMLYKKLNYLITLEIATKLAPDALNDYIEGNIALEELEKQLPDIVDTNMLDMYFEQLVLDYDSIKVIPDDEEEINDEDDSQLDANGSSLLYGLAYIRSLYNLENNKDNSESTLNELAGLFEEIIDHAFENGEVNLTFKKDLIFNYYLHSDKDNIHIRFNVDINSGKVIVINPVTKQPMNIDIFTDWWVI